MTVIINGTSGVTFPNSTTQASAGAILQVVQATYSTQTANSSNSYVSTGLSASITPKFSTSKVLVIYNIPTYITRNATGGIQGLFLLSRNGTSVYVNTTSIGGQAAVGNGGSTGFNSVVNAAYLDSPTTTSSTTYTVYNAVAFVESGYTVTTQYAAQPSTITLMEVAG